MEAKIKTVCLSEEKGTTKKVKKGDLIENFGLKGDAHAGKWHRHTDRVYLQKCSKVEKLKLEIK
ncbi:MAG: hypothetical protein ACOCUG_00360 [Halanaerobium sp.]